MSVEVTELSNFSGPSIVGANVRPPAYVAMSSHAVARASLPLSNLVAFFPLDESFGSRYDVIGGKVMHEEYRVPAGEVDPPDIANTAGRLNIGSAALLSGTPAKCLSAELGYVGVQQIALAFHFKFTLMPTHHTPIVCIAPRPSTKYVLPHLPAGLILSIGVEPELPGGPKMTVYAGRTDVNVDRFVSSFTPVLNTWHHVLVYSTGFTWGEDWGQIGFAFDGDLESWDRTIPFLECGPSLYIGENPTADFYYYSTHTPPAGLAVDNLSVWQGAEFSEQNIADIYNSGRGFEPIASLATDLEAYWRLNETAGTRRDSITGYYDLREFSTPVAIAAGKLGNAADFEGDDAVYLYANPRPHHPRGEFTICAWVKLDAAGLTEDQVILGNLLADGGVSRGFRLSALIDEPITLDIGDGTASVKRMAWAEAPAADTWYFVCAGVNAAGVMFISVNNGDRETLAGAWPAHSRTLLLFGRDPTGKPLDGKVDEVALYRRALTVDEQAALYNGGTGLTWPF